MFDNYSLNNYAYFISVGRFHGLASLSVSEPHKLEIRSCSSGSVESRAYSCKHAYDGVLGPGDYKEWSSAEDDDDAWLRLDFASAEKVGMLKIWWRCAGQSQFSELNFSFSDGSTQLVGPPIRMVA